MIVFSSINVPSLFRIHNETCSPLFTEYPAPYICAGQPYCYNNGSIDVDGDSLVYSLQTPLNNNVSY